MTEPTVKTIKRLFAKSNNQCAFPDCMAPIVENDGTVTGEMCHIKASSPGGPRYDSKQSEKERHDYDNLILMCSRHHKIIDSNENEYPSGVLESYKRAHEFSGVAEINPQTAKIAEKILESYKLIVVNKGGKVHVNQADAIHANTVNFPKTKRKPKIEKPYPFEAIGNDLKMKTYAKYLIDRYNDFQKLDKEKTKKYKYIAIYNAIKREFYCKWDHVAKSRFHELVAFLQNRIDKTKFGRIQKSRGTRNYHSFEEHC